MDSWVPYERLPAEQGLEPEGWGGVDAVPARLEEPVSEPDLLPPDVAENAESACSYHSVRKYRYRYSSFSTVLLYNLDCTVLALRWLCQCICNVQRIYPVFYLFSSFSTGVPVRTPLSMVFRSRMRRCASTSTAGSPSASPRSGRRARTSSGSGARGRWSRASGADRSRRARALAENTDTAALTFWLYGSGCSILAFQLWLYQSIYDCFRLC